MSESTTAPEGAKRCTKCGEVKQLDDFHRNSRKNRAATHVSACKDCISAARARRLSDPNALEQERTRTREAQRERRKDPGARKVDRDYARERRAANPDGVRKVVRDSARRARAKDPEGVRQKLNEWIEANPGRWAQIKAKSSAKRRARKFQSFFEDVDRQQVWDAYNGICHICGQEADPDNWHLEHVVALAAGGSHSYRNCAVAHKLCNSSKGPRHVPSALGLRGAYSLAPVTCLR